MNFARSRDSAGTIQRVKRKPGHGMILIGSRGLPEAVVKKLAKAFKEGLEGPKFQEVLNRFDLPYDYKDRAQLE